MDRAKSSLSEARVMFENSFLFAALNRCYYAAFYAATALLLTKSKSSSKHSGVLSLFRSHVVKAGLISAESGRFYGELYKYRLKTDYDDYAELRTLEALSWLDKATQFVNQIDAIIEEKLS